LYIGSKFVGRTKRDGAATVIVCDEIFKCLSGAPSGPKIVDTRTLGHPIDSYTTGDLEGTRSSANISDTFAEWRSPHLGSLTKSSIGPLNVLNVLNTTSIGSSRTRVGLIASPNQNGSSEDEGLVGKILAERE